jgi:hypothetical protein
MPGALLWIKLPGESDGICGGEHTYLFAAVQARRLTANSPWVHPQARRLAASALFTSPQARSDSSRSTAQPELGSARTRVIDRRPRRHGW